MEKAFEDTQRELGKVNVRKGTPSDIPDNSLVFVDIKQFRSFVEKHGSVIAQPSDFLAEQAVQKAVKYHYGKREPVVKIRDGVYATHFSKMKGGSDIGTVSGYFIEPLEV